MYSTRIAGGIKSREMKGNVLWYNVRKGFGTIMGADGNRYFAHKSNLPFWTIFLTKGDLVEFLVEDDKRGAVAKDIKVVKRN